MSIKEIEIDKKSGFCFGVIKAIEIAEQQLKNNEPLYSLGDIVHNAKEVNRLENKGMTTITHEDFGQFEKKKILIRAHGEPPATYKQAEEQGHTIVDATCPVVLKLQKRVAEAYEKMVKVDGNVVIYGKKGHAEVNGLLGHTNNKGIVIETVDDLDKIDYSKPIYLLSQTTKSIEGFNKVLEIIQHRMVSGASFEWHDSICRQVANRLPRITEFATKHDVVIFVSGLKSSNGKVLFEACKKENAQTYFVSAKEEVDIKWFQSENSLSVGICGATSTPQWLMEEVAQEIREIAKKL